MEMAKIAIFALLVLFEVTAFGASRSVCDIDPQIKKVLESHFSKTCEEIDQLESPKISILNLSDLGLTYFDPEDLSKFSIEYINLSNNKISCLLKPGKWNFIKIIDLSNNQITTVSESFFDGYNGYMAMLGNNLDKETLKMIKSKVQPVPVGYEKTPVEKETLWSLEYDFDYLAINTAEDIFKTKVSPQTLAASKTFLRDLFQRFPQTRWLVRSTGNTFHNLNSVLYSGVRFFEEEDKDKLQIYQQAEADYKKLISCGFELRKYDSKLTIATLKEINCGDEDTNKLRQKLSDYGISVIYMKMEWTSDGGPVLILTTVLTNLTPADRSTWTRRGSDVIKLANEIAEKWPGLAQLFAAVAYNGGGMQIVSPVHRFEWEISDIHPLENGEVKFKLYMASLWLGGLCQSTCASLGDEDYEVHIDASGKILNMSVLKPQE